MAKKNLFGLFEPIIITVFWLVLFMSPIFLSDSNYSLDWNHVLRIWISFIPYLLLFLVNRYVLLPYLFFQNRRLHFLVSALILISIMAIGVYQFRRIVFEQPGQIERVGQLPPPSQRFSDRPTLRDQNPTIRNQNLPPQGPPRELPPYIGFIVISILIVGFDTGLRLSVKWVRSEQMRTFMEKENMEIQLAFLRNQISPHFFMNTLNNIHALIDISTEDAKESVIKLSKLMRYLLYESDHEKVPLSKEVEFIRSYVELMKLRYNDKVLINLSFPEVIPSMEISPMLFTSIVENAFKYGVSYQHESFIDILMNTDENDLYFRIRNSVHPNEGKEDESGGIGLVNLQKRLDLIYGKNHSISTSQNNDIFEINIRIPLYDN